MTLVTIKKDMVFVCILTTWALEYAGDYNYGWPQVDHAS
jgi:hypothetical protein